VSYLGWAKLLVSLSQSVGLGSEGGTPRFQSFLCHLSFATSMPALEIPGWFPSKAPHLD